MRMLEVGLVCYCFLWHKKQCKRDEPARRGTGYLGWRHGRSRRQQHRRALHPTHSCRDAGCGLPLGGRKYHRRTCQQLFQTLHSATWWHPLGVANGRTLGSKRCRWHIDWGMDESTYECITGGLSAWAYLALARCSCVGAPVSRGGGYPTPRHSLSPCPPMVAAYAITCVSISSARRNTSCKCCASNGAAFGVPRTASHFNLVIGSCGLTSRRRFIAR